MADGRDRLAGAVEVTDDVEHALVEPDVLRRAAAGDDEGVVARPADLVEGGVEGEQLWPRFSV